MNSEIPIELSLLQLDKLPGQYHMFFSSAYNTISNFHSSSKFTSHFIPLELYSVETKVYEDIYITYEGKNNIEIVY